MPAAPGRSEFGLIGRYFSALGARREDVALGVGDDAAVLVPPAGEQLVACIDTLVEGVHFPRGCEPRSVGHRALAVNLSDLAAMGARPAWALLALTLPAVDESWLERFAAGLGELAREHGVALVGGDTTAGPLCITVQALGFVPAGAALTRTGGRPGDAVFVSGTPGDAAAGLLLEQGRLKADEAENDALRQRFLYPAPRLALGQRLRGLASACIDVSDGLLADCGKLAAASGCGVVIDCEALPLSAALRTATPEAATLALTGGDDYELAFAVPQSRVPALLAAAPPARWGYQRIGELVHEPGAVARRAGAVLPVASAGYDHFG